LNWCFDHFTPPPRRLDGLTPSPSEREGGVPGNTHAVLCARASSLFRSPHSWGLGGQSAPTSGRSKTGVLPGTPPSLSEGEGETTPRAAWGEGCETPDQGVNIALALGSNLGDREANLAFGREELGRRGVQWQAISSLYETEPVGPVADQPPFLNQVAIGATLLTARALLEVCLHVEKMRGRERTVHWGPRTLDLDILLYGNSILEERDLIVPHREMAGRAFVLVPLAEIAGDWLVPGYNKTVRELLAATAGREGVRIWQSSDTK
jgi:2-amino-4-hydroxy-6-hydroxymethyldihydropteridine diphosphokinase